MSLMQEQAGREVLNVLISSQFYFFLGAKVVYTHSLKSCTLRHTCNHIIDVLSLHYLRNINI